MTAKQTAKQYETRYRTNKACAWCASRKPKTVYLTLYGSRLTKEWMCKKHLIESGAC